MNLRALYEELKRRKVVRVTAVYVAGGLALIYAADVILPRLGVPEWTVTLVIVLVGLGLPFAVGLAWAFDLTPEGVVRDPGPPAHSPGAVPESSRDARSSTAGAPSRGAPETFAGGQGGAGAAAPDRPAIVVLPFADLSPARDNEYFSDGLTEEIIADLSGIGALRVISRTSSMRLKGTDLDVRAIGHELGVRYALEGSVRKAGTNLRITAQLIDARTDDHMWAGRYDGALDDVFDLQERVAREIVQALDLTMTSEEDARLADHAIRDVRAFELFLRARDKLRRYDGGGVEDLLSRAMEIEGRTPPLRALWGWAKVHEVRVGVNRDMGPLAEAEREARALLAEDPDASYGHALLGYIEYEKGDQSAAVRHFRAALEIEPNDEDTLFYCGIALQSAGHPDDAMEAADRLLESDPLSPLSHLLKGVVPWFLGRAAESPPHLRRALELDPQNAIAHWCLGYTLALLDRGEDAETHADWLAAHAPAIPYTGHLRALLHALKADTRAAALECADAMDMAPLDSHKIFHMAEVYAMCGEVDRGLEMLALAVDGGFYPYRFIAEYCPFLDPLRDDPHFAEVAARARGRMEAFDGG